MKHTYFAGFVLSTVLPCLALSASDADGVIGRNHVDLDAGYIFSDEDLADFSGSVVGLNGRYNLSRGSSVGWDLNGRIEYVSVDYDNIPVDADQWTYDAGLTVFVDNGGAFVPYAELGLGFVETSVEDYSDDSYTHSFAVGTEIFLSQGVSIIPQIRLNKAPDISDDYETTYSLRVNAKLADRYRVYGLVSQSEIDGLSSYKFMLGVSSNY
jgi:hypothetical protein